MNKLHVPLQESLSDDKIEILNIKVSPNENFLAVLAGKNLIKGIEELWELHIYKLTDDGGFQHITSIMLPEEFRSFSVSFEYKQTNQDTTLIFTDVNGIMHYNFMKEELKVMYAFNNPIGRQPDYIVFDDKQEIAIIASTDDVLWVNIKLGVEIDIDEQYLLGDIKSLKRVKDKFYVLANKYQRKLGYFLLELNQNLDPKNISATPPRYVIKWENKLEIDNASLDSFISNDEDTEDQTNLIVSYKSIHVNTYTVFLINIETGRIQFKHDNYQLWESPVLGFLNTFQNDFVILNKEGTSFLPLGKKEKRAIHNPSGSERMVHSLPSCDYLKIDKSNMLSFERPNQGSNNRTVKILMQQLDQDGNTYYDNIYQVNIDEMELRELMVI